jgi:hypothetical protein
MEAFDESLPTGVQLELARVRLGLTPGMACHRFAWGYSELARIESSRMEEKDETLKTTMVEHYRKNGALK